MPLQPAAPHLARRLSCHLGISGYKQSILADGKECIEIPARDDPSYQCFIGTKLCGSCTSGKVYNGARYSVTSIGGDKITLQDDITRECFELTPEAVSKSCILSHALTFNKVQGCTETGSIMLHQTSHQFFTKSHLYVGLSRAVDGSRVHLASD